MKRALTLLLIFLCLCPALRAEPWSNERYRCSLTMPEAELWSYQGLPPNLGIGEVLFVRSYKQETIAVVVIPNIPPPADLRNAGIVSRILEVVKSMGFTVDSRNEMMQGGTRFLEIVGQRDDGLGTKSVGVARATVRDDVIFIALASGNGGPELAKDPHFLRVLNTFQLVEAIVKKRDPASHPLFQHYRMAFRGSLVGAAGLLGLGLLIILFSRRRE